MKRLLVGVWLCSLAACGPPAAPSIEKDLEVYVQSFKSRTGVTPKSDVVFGALDGTTAGICEVWSDGYTKVTVDREYFDTINENQREELMYHELGHCELDRDHSEAMTYKGGKRVPESVMYPYVFSLTWAQVYDTFRPEYVQELLSGK